jgi:OOP family OmpA-OmpF porin
MKYIFKFLTVVVALWACVPMAKAQKLDGLGVSFGANDFYGPQTGNYFTNKTFQTYNNTETQKLDTIRTTRFFWDPFVRVTYWHELNKHFDVNLGLTAGNILYPQSNKDSNYIKLKDAINSHYKRILLEFDARINYNILRKDKYIIAPYLFAGVTGSFHTPYFGFDVPVGLGVNAHLPKNHDFYVNLEAGYKLAITSNDFNHLQYTAGFVYWYKPHYKRPVQTIQAAMEELKPAPDMDNDGVPDSLDKCPTIPGLAEFAGCPDTDGDGVPDNLDKCPLVPGLKNFDGCPDSDGDGIPDNVDKCPYQAGTAQYNGCPPPDRDHDGVLDIDDKCPDEAGPATNGGCPVIQKEVIELVERAARSVYFEEGKAVLKKVSYKSLDKITGVMTNNPKLYIDIAGYTDSFGSDERNVKLSDNRANVCKKYIIDKGVSPDRITAKGYGKADPVAANKTALGRAQNRRTEFRLRNYLR